MKRDLLISAAVVIIIGVSCAKADLILTLEGQNITGIPFMTDGTGPYQIAIDGNTTFGPNDIRFETVGGTLTEINDVNHQYSFQYETGSTAGLIWLISNTEMTIDDITIPSDTTIYEIFIFSNLDVNLTGACGSDLSFFFPPLEEGGGEGDSLEGQDTFTMESEGGGDSLLDSVIEISSDITTNQIWTANNTYHIAADINVKALLVIEPGTVVKFGQGTTMFVNDGGVLISSGTPENPIRYIPDIDFSGYSYYYCPLYIEESASSLTKITYSYIVHAFVGILLLNQHLESPIENNYLYSSVYGIVEYGTKHTEIKNNLLYDIGLTSIEVFLASESGQTDPYSYIAIYNNTCTHNQFVGIRAHGVETIEEAGYVDITNNIVSESQAFGIEIVDGTMYVSLYCNGFYGNDADTNDLDSLMDYPFYESSTPFVEGSGLLPFCYLRQDCNFIDNGYELIEETTLIGKTTDMYKQPDINCVDIGFHYPNWNYSNVGDGNIVTMDLNGDLSVDFKDFAILSSVWQTDYNINDLNKMADEWLKFSGTNIHIQIDGDSNSGYVNVHVIDNPQDILRNFLLVDGQYVGELIFFENGQKLHLDISALSDGSHDLKIISTDINENIICSYLTQTSFICPFKYCTSINSYAPNQPYYFSSFYQGSGNITVKVIDEDNILLWSQTYSAQNTNGFVPSTITSRGDLGAIIFEPPQGSGSSVTKTLAMAFIPWLVPSDIRALIILPSMEINVLNRNVQKIIEQTFTSREVPYYKLELLEATYKNLNWFALYRDIDYIYFAGHGQYKIGDINGVGGMLRTNIYLWDGWVASAKRSDFGPGGAPSWCVELPGNFEKTMHSMTGIYFAHALKYVYLDCCNSGRLCLTSNNQLTLTPKDDYDMPAPPPGSQSDMSWAMGMNSIFDSFYQGWWGDVWKGPYEPINLFSVDEWTELRYGESLYSALMEAIYYAEIEALENFTLFGDGNMYSFRIE